MEFTKKKAKVNLSPFRVDPDLKGQVSAVSLQTGKSYSEVMTYLVEMGIAAHLNSNVEKQKEVKTVASVKPAKWGKAKFAAALIELGANPDDVGLFMDVRAAKKAVNTEAALKQYVGSLGDYTVQQAVAICAGEQWKGFKPKWAENLAPEQKQRYSFMELAQGKHLETIPNAPAQSQAIDYAAQFDALRLENNA